MRKVIFYTEALWAFGSLHNEMCKFLMAHGVNAILMDWKIPYTVEEMQEINATEPIWCTEPHATEVLVKQYGISPKQIVLIAHSVADVEWSAANINIGDYREFVVLSEFLADTAIRVGFPWRPPVQHLGTNTNDFNFHYATKLERVGFAGTLREDYAHNKRPWLVQQACENAGLEFVAAETYHNTFVTMPGFYKSVDAIVISSMHEGDGMVSLEGGASGRMVFSTSVGHWPELCSAGGGVTLPMGDQELVQDLTARLEYFKANPERFAEQCREIQLYSQRYDWALVASDWAQILW